MINVVSNAIIILRKQTFQFFLDKYYPNSNLKDGREQFIISNHIINSLFLRRTTYIISALQTWLESAVYNIPTGRIDFF